MTERYGQFGRNSSSKSGENGERQIRDFGIIELHGWLALIGDLLSTLKCTTPATFCCQGVDDCDCLVDQVHTEQIIAGGIFVQDLRLVAIHLDLLNTNERWCNSDLPQ